MSYVVLLGALLTAVVTLPAALSAQTTKLDENLAQAVHTGCSAPQRVIIRTTAGYRETWRNTLTAHGDRVEADHYSLNAISVVIHCDDLAVLDKAASIVSLSSNAVVTSDAAQASATTLSKAAAEATRAAALADALAKAAAADADRTQQAFVTAQAKADAAARAASDAATATGRMNGAPKVTAAMKSVASRTLADATAAAMKTAADAKAAAAASVSARAKATALAKAAATAQAKAAQAVALAKQAEATAAEQTKAASAARAAADAKKKAAAVAREIAAEKVRREQQLAREGNSAAESQQRLFDTLGVRKSRKAMVDANLVEQPAGTVAAAPDDFLRTLLGTAAEADQAGIGVAVIDSGVQPGADFDDRITHFFDFTKPGTPKASAPLDEYGHGTHVAGLIASKWVGIAPGARIIALRVLDQNGQGQTSDVLRAIEFAITNRAALGIDVINLSLGHPVFEPAATDPLVQAVEQAVRAGIVVVASAGNFGVNPKTGQPGYAGIASPGNAPSALAIASLKTFDTVTRLDDRIASYSSRGPTWYDGYAKPDLAVPGDSLLSIAAAGSKLRKINEQRGGSGDYMRLSGTSMAAGVASGIVALILNTNHGLTPNAVKAALEFSAIPAQDDGGTLYDTLTQGAGAVNGAGALALARAIDPSLPVGSRWLSTGVAMVTYIGGEPMRWSKQMVWGAHIVRGDDIVTENRPAWALNIVWGDATGDDNIVWGNVADDNIVWGNSFDDGDNIVWGNNFVWADAWDQGDNIVWGNAFDDNIVWGNNVVWGNSLVGMTDGDNIVWGNAVGEGDNIVWGNLADDNIVWGNLYDDNIVWGNVDGDNIVWGNSVLWGDRTVKAAAPDPGRVHRTRKSNCGGL